MRLTTYQSALLYAEHRSTFLQAKSVNKWINAQQKCRKQAGFEARMSGRKVNTITTDLKGILLNAVVWCCISIGMNLCMKEWSPVTHPVQVTYDSMANPRWAPTLRTKSGTKKQVNKCIAEIQGRTEFKPRTPRRKANTITTELKGILPDAVVGYCIFNRDESMNEGVVSRNNIFINETAHFLKMCTRVVQKVFGLSMIDEV